MVPRPIDNCIEIATGMFSVEIGVWQAAPGYPVCRDKVRVRMAHDKLPNHFNAMV